MPCPKNVLSLFLIYFLPGKISIYNSDWHMLQVIFYPEKTRGRLILVLTLPYPVDKLSYTIW